ncbi:Transketolase [Chlamydiales bacterium SCGC AG-110-M15]|nr:Transketolase [Chlamydiales bacterium SCGC AG-110-M15]
METQQKEALDSEVKKVLEKAANTIRHLSIDAVQKANSGHPGMPMGCAELGAYLYGCGLSHNPKNSSWINRDRFILSAGHGSMFLYSCLHLSGFDLSMDDIKSFRQFGSKTPGHPEDFLTDGVETTSGPLGQGIAFAVGQALGMKILGSRFNTDDHTIFNNKIVALAGDGCFMEGISSEASSFAGHLNLDNLILFYDYNRISLDGPLSDSCSEDTKMRYKSYGWSVREVDGHDLDQIHEVYSDVRAKQKKPTLIIAHTVIGKGSPNKAGTHKVHGAPLGNDEIQLTKESLGLPEEDFYVPRAVRAFFETKLEGDAANENNWKDLFHSWAASNPDLYREFDQMKTKFLPEDIEEKLWNVELKDPSAGRTASNEVLNRLLGPTLPYIYGGSADLSCSDMTMMSSLGVIAPGSFTGRNIKYGVREFAMGAICTGLAQTDFFLPYCGTFLTFSDYMRNTIRLAALMKKQVVYQMTHDSIFVGEDGPTHQPVEHIASLRAIPGLHVMRPADNNEVRMAWMAALAYKGPTLIALSRNKLPEFDGTKVPYEEGVGRGAYIVMKEEGQAEFTFFATGSELSLAMDVASELKKLSKSVRVISMPCWELFENQSERYRESIVGGDLGKRISVEAGVEMGWHKYVGSDGITIAVDGFGASAPAGILAKEYGFTMESILERIL